MQLMEEKRMVQKNIRSSRRPNRRRSSGRLNTKRMRNGLKDVQNSVRSPTPKASAPDRKS